MVGRRSAQRSVLFKVGQRSWRGEERASGQDSYRFRISGREWRQDAASCQGGGRAASVDRDLDMDVNGPVSYSHKAVSTSAHGDSV